MAAFKKRAIVVAVDFSDPSLAAANWAVQECWREGDVIHLVHVSRSLAPHVDITHSYAGATYSMPNLKPQSLNQEAVSKLNEAIKNRFNSWMDKRGVPHSLHLYLDTDNAPASAICKLIFDVAEEVNAALIVTACHSKAGMIQELLMGSVAEYCTRNSRWPTVSVRSYPLPGEPAPSSSGGTVCPFSPSSSGPSPLQAQGTTDQITDWQAQHTGGGNQAASGSGPDLGDGSAAAACVSIPQSKAAVGAAAAAPQSTAVDQVAGRLSRLLGSPAGPPAPGGEAALGDLGSAASMGRTAEAVQGAVPATPVAMPPVVVALDEVALLDG